MGEVDAHISRSWLIAAFHLSNLRLSEKRAVGVEPFGQAAHRALHHVVEIRLLDVIAHDERHDILKHPQMRVGVVGARQDIAEEAADHDERDHRCGDQDGDESSA